MNKYAVIGLGFVGLNLAVSFAKHSTTYGYDINHRRIDKLKDHIDENKLFTPDMLEDLSITFTDNLEEIKQANFYIVTVATPVNYFSLPELGQLVSASKSLAKILKKGDIVVYESSVYPGTTEEVCIPILNNHSNLESGKDFFVGYSPERINPSDNQHTLFNITKIISGQNEYALQRITEAYKSICKEVYPVSCMAVAEAAKILENTQRDVNIALMNEFSKLMHALNLDTNEIIEAAKTKWNFAPYKPGLVGGHCIPVDPLYLSFQAKRHGLSLDLTLAARKINDDMTGFILQSLIKILLNHKINMSDIIIGFFGITYKPNLIDYRNSLALKLLTELQSYDFNCKVHDPFNHDMCLKNVDAEFEEFEDINNVNVVIILVGHDYYKDLGLQDFVKKCKDKPIIMDIPGLFLNEKKSAEDLIYWNL